MRLETDPSELIEVLGETGKWSVMYGFELYGVQRFVAVSEDTTKLLCLRRQSGAYYPFRGTLDYGSVQNSAHLLLSDPHASQLAHTVAAGFLAQDGCLIHLDAAGIIPETLPTKDHAHGS